MNDTPILPILPERRDDSHKGDYGHALLVGGSPHMPGAITLATLAALRAGAGLTTVAASRTTLHFVHHATPCAMGYPLDEQPNGFLDYSAIKQILPRYQYQTVLAIGPGLGRDSSQDTMAVDLFERWPGTAVFDADALNALSDRKTNPCSLYLHAHSPRILTPHPGEFERLTEIPASDLLAQRKAAVELAKANRLVIVLKSHRTLVTDGVNVFENPTGNPSLAVGGSGDCLTGIITALACQGLGAYEAAVLGVFLHGLAGDIAHRELGTPSTLGTDLIHAIPAAFRHYRSLNQSF
jgi:ADP-dependent NAD(P)H-hydrate dehydratase